MKQLFGTLFDFDGDGKVSAEDELFGMTMMQSQMMRVEDDTNCVNSSLDYNKLPTIVPAASCNETYRCGVKSFQAITGCLCSSTGLNDRNQYPGFLLNDNAMYHYNSVSKVDFDKYINYLKSIGVNPNDYTCEYGIITYSYMVKDQKGRVWCIDVSFSDNEVKVLHAG